MAKAFSYFRNMTHSAYSEVSMISCWSPCFCFREPSPSDEILPTDDCSPRSSEQDENSQISPQNSENIISLTESNPEGRPQSSDGNSCSFSLSKFPANVSFSIDIPTGTGVDSDCAEAKYLHQYTFSELKKATCGFKKPDLVLGEGAFGIVYRGWLKSPEGILDVAVKRLNPEAGFQGEEEWMVMDSGIMT